MNYEVLKNVFQIIYITTGLLTFADVFLWIGLRMCKKYKIAKKAAVAVLISSFVCGFSMLLYVAVSRVQYYQ